MLPANWSHGNPVDIIGDATPERYRDAVTLCMEDPGVDGVLVILTPQAMTNPLEVAKAVIEIASRFNKPLLTCWMGDIQVKAGRAAFRPGRHSHLQHAGTGGRGVLLHLRLLPQPAPAGADARPALAPATSRTWKARAC